MAKKNCCLFENLMLGKLLNFFKDLPRVAYKMVAYKKKYVYIEYAKTEFAKSVNAYSASK